MHLNDNLWILTGYGGQKGAVAWNPENDRNRHRYKMQDFINWGTFLRYKWEWTEKISNKNQIEYDRA